MSKKTLIIGLITFLILCFFTVLNAEQYYDQYSGNGFQPKDDSLSYHKDYYSGYIFHNDNSLNPDYNCPVHFDVPDGSTYFIKSIGIRFIDNRTDGYIQVGLHRENLYTGAIHTVASWTSSGSSAFYRTDSQGTMNGFKLIDTKKFVYWLWVYFHTDGDINPSSDLVLFQVRIHYGT